MNSLKEKNWHLPKWLNWLPKALSGEGDFEEIESVGQQGEGFPFGEPVPEAIPVRIDE